MPLLANSSSHRIHNLLHIARALNYCCHCLAPPNIYQIILYTTSKMANTSIGLLMEIVKPTTTAAAVDGVCNFNCGAVCNNDANTDNDTLASEVSHEERPKKDNRDDHDQSAKPDYSEYARDCVESQRQEGSQLQYSEHDFVQVSSADVEDKGCLFGEFGFGHFVLDLFSSLNPCRLKNLKNELEKAKESNAKLEWELKTQLLRIRQEREAIESKLRSEIDHEISQAEVLHAFLEAEEEEQKLETDLRDDQQITETAQIIHALEAHKKEKLRSKPLVLSMSSTIGVSSSTADSAESNIAFSLNNTHVAAE